MSDYVGRSEEGGAARRRLGQAEIAQARSRVGAEGLVVPGGAGAFAPVQAGSSITPGKVNP